MRGVLAILGKSPPFEGKIPLWQAFFPSLFMDIPLWKAKSPISELKVPLGLRKRFTYMDNVKEYEL